MDAPRRPSVPVVDVEICPADARRLHFDDDVCGRRAWLHHLLEGESRLGSDLPQRLHGGILAGPPVQSRYQVFVRGTGCIRQARILASTTMQPSETHHGIEIELCDLRLIFGQPREPQHDVFQRSASEGGAPRNPRRAVRPSPSSRAPRHRRR